MKIYTVITMFIIDEKIQHDRVVGWFQDKEEAVKCVKENWGDIYECGYYNYALVEKVCDGLYNMSKDRREESWFSVEPVGDSKGCVIDYDIKSVDKPSFLHNVINFSIG